jgi:hypothetical protein
MPKTTATRSYSMSDSDLKQTADDIAGSVSRDLADFATRKVTATNVTDLKNLATDFANHSTDEELLGEVMNATANKNAIVESVILAIKPIRNMAENVYGTGGKYRSFGFEGMIDMSAEDLYKLAKRVVRMGTKYLAELGAEGLTAAQLTALQTLANNLDAALDAIDDAVKNRDIETQDRIIKGNHLWDVISKLAGTGKSIYEDTNEAKYNDYVLTPSAGGSGSTPETPNS